MHLEDAAVFGALLLERDRLERPVVGADRDHALAHQIARAVTAQPGLDRTVALRVLVDQAQPAGVEDDHVALPNLDALFLRDRVDLGLVEGRAFLDHVDAVVRRHVEQHTARDHRRHGVGPELLHAADARDVAPLQAVVVAVADTDVAEPVDLRADAGPAVQDVVVVGRVGVAQALARAGLARLHDVDRAGARWVGRRRGADGDAERVDLAGLDELGGLQRDRRGQVVRGAEFVFRAPLARVPGGGLRRGREGRGERERADDAAGDVFRDLFHVVVSSGGENALGRPFTPGGRPGFSAARARGAS